MEAADGWFYSLDGGFEGPSNVQKLLELLHAGTITRQTPVWREGVPDWQPLEKALGFDQAPPPLPGAPAGMPPPPPAIQHPSDPAAAPIAAATQHPWRRYFARMIDTLVGGAVVWFAIGLVGAMVAPDTIKQIIDYVSGPNGRAINTISTIFFAIFPNALFIGLTGSSIGKVILGVRVLSPDGSPIGFSRALKREFDVWAAGLGLGIPLVSFVTLIMSYQKLKKDGIMSWDKSLPIQIVYRPATALQTFLNVVGVVLFFVISVVLLAWANAGGK